MAGNATARIAEHPRAVDLARVFSYDFLLEDDTDPERHCSPSTARARDAPIEDAALHIALELDPQSAAQTREAITPLIDPSGNQLGPREEDR
jgi:hypothetical protein